MLCFRRFYHTTRTVYSMKKQGIKLNKMLNPKAKSHWYVSNKTDSATMPALKSLTKTKNEPGKRAVRRVAMLNKLFMKHITDMMSTGTTSIDIVGRGIEISKVNITPDFQTVNVFWVCKGNSSDEETENILKSLSGALRHELSNLRVMGEVPYIIFVKDKHESQIVDLDRRLALADYGEDYEPTEIGHLLKTEFTLNTKLSPEMKAKIKQLEEELPIEDEPVPEMTHNVYGLDHAKILSRLQATRSRSREAWLNINENKPVLSYRAPAVQVDDTDYANQRKELADFLMKRQILQAKLRREMRRSRESFQLQPQVEEDDDEPYDSDDEEDYYEDDDCYYYKGNNAQHLSDSPKLA